MSRVYGSGDEMDKTIIGWETGPPRKGERYSIYLGRGKYLKSSPVEEIIQEQEALMIKTANSLYELKYLE